MCSRVLGLDWWLLRCAWKEDAAFIIAGWNELTILFLVATLAAAKKRFAIWTDTPDLEKRRGALKRLTRAWWLRWLFRNATAVFGTGAPALSALLRMGCPQAKMVNFPFVVDLEAFKPQPNTPASTKIVFLSCGRLVNSHKGYDLAIRALALLRDHQLLADFEYRIAGDGPDRIGLEQLAQDTGLGDNVRFLGWLEPRELPGFYGSGDIFLHPSHFDPYPNVVLEAMASGLPIIGSEKAGSVTDGVKAGVNGLVHRDNDIEDLAAKIERIATDHQRRWMMGRESRRSAHDWSPQSAVEAVKRVFLDPHL
jgi:glycosyltransferase involved in cell wall biosynthesis